MYTPKCTTAGRRHKLHVYRITNTISPHNMHINIAPSWIAWLHFVSSFVLLAASFS